jgi:hypothetical protein
MVAGTSGISPDEIFFRRILLDHFKPPNDLSPQAFTPRKSDVDGLSLLRKRFCKRPEDAAAEGPLGMSFYVIEITCAEVHQLGLSVKQQGPVQHAVIPELHAGTEFEQMDAIAKLRELTASRPLGPFPGRKLRKR